MFRKWLQIFFMLALTAAGSHAATAQTVKAEQQKLATYQSQLQQAQADLQQYQSELASARKAKVPLEGGDGPEKDQLDQAAAELAEAQATYEADPTDDNKSRVKNAEFKQALAERKYKKANEKLYEVQERIDNLEGQVKKANADVARLNKAVADQKAAVEKARSNEIAARQAREAEQQRLKAEAAEAELARVKAELARKEREEAARQASATAAAQKAAAAKAAAPAANAMSAPAMKAAAPAPAAPKVAVAKPTPTAPAAASDTASSGVIMLTTRDAVAAEQRRLEQLLAKPDTSKSKYNKILNVKPIGADGNPGKAEAHSLQALGHGQYRGIAHLKGGEAEFVVGFNSWRQTVPGSGDEKDYVVILDTSNPKTPRLVYFPETLTK